MIGFELGESMYECPAYWANFISDLQDRELISMKIIQQELKKYGAEYHQSDLGEPNHWIRFKDEKHYTMFILKWS